MRLSEITKIEEAVDYDADAIAAIKQRMQPKDDGLGWEAIEYNIADDIGAKPIKNLSKEEAIETAKYLAARRFKWLERDGVNAEKYGMAVVRYEPMKWKVVFKGQYGEWRYEARQSKSKKDKRLDDL